MPLGALLAVARFPGRRAIIVLLNALLGLPSVVVGLVVYLLLSRAGPLGALGILFTPTAMVIAQTILVTPLHRGADAPGDQRRLAGDARAAALARRRPARRPRWRCCGTCASRW